MYLPIQAAPIDRANRAVAVRTGDHAGKIGPQAGPGDFCMICDVFPPIPRAICKAICGAISSGG